MSDELLDSSLESSYTSYYTKDAPGKTDGLDNEGAGTERKEVFFRAKEYGESDTDYDRAYKDYERSRSWGMGED